MIEITEIQECSKYFYAEQMEQIMDFIQDETNNSDFTEQVSKEYEEYATGKKLWSGLFHINDVDLKNGDTKNIIVEYIVKLKFDLPLAKIWRITIYDNYNDSLLDKIIDYKKLLGLWKK